MSNLPERYAYAVTKHLPQAQRKEVADELHTTIDDMAADRSKNGNPTEADYKAVLQELGNPEILARKYTQTRQYLIGPKWFDAYKQLMITLLSIVPAIVGVVVLAVNMLVENNQIIPALLDTFGSAIAAAIHISFWVTAVFAFLERLAIKPESMDSHAWTPDDLPQVPKNLDRQIPKGESIANIVLLVLAAAWFALNPIVNVKNGEILFNTNLDIMWIIGFFGLVALSLVQKIAEYKVGNWTKPLVMSNLVISVTSVAYLIALFTTQETFNVGYFMAWGIEGSAEQIARVMDWIAGFAVASTAIVYAWEILQSFIKHRQLTKKQK